jgi:hypothetical protein
MLERDFQRQCIDWLCFSYKDPAGRSIHCPFVCENWRPQLRGRKRQSRRDGGRGFKSGGRQSRRIGKDNWRIEAQLPLK